MVNVPLAVHPLALPVTVYVACGCAVIVIGLPLNEFP